MPQIQNNSEAIGGDADDMLDQGVAKAQDAADGTLKGSYKATGIMTETALVVSAYGSINSSMNQSAQQAGNK